MPNDSSILQQAIASANGILALISKANGKVQQVASDEFGRLWTRLFVNGAAVSNANPLPVTGIGGNVSVQGIIAHDTPDNEATNFPIKIGGHANAAQRPDVGEDDIADISVDLAGRVRVAIASPQGDANTGSYIGIASFANGAIVAANHDRDLGLSSDAAVITDSAMTVTAGIRGLVSRSSTATQGLMVVGNIAHDTAEGAPGPVGIGGTSVAVPATGAAVTTAGDRTRAVLDLAGRIIALVQGTQLHDEVMLAANGPINHGGVAGTQAPTGVSALDLVQAYFDTFGRQQTNQEQGIAGEVLSSNVMRGLQALLPIEQDSAEQSNPALVGTMAATLIVRATNGRFYRVSVTNTTAAGVYVHVINNTTAVAPGAQIIDTFFVPALGTAVIDLSGYNGDYCDTGLCLAGSTSPIAITSPGSVLKFYVRFA